MFLDELLPDFYKKIGLEFRRARFPGQICYSPILFLTEHRELWRPDGYDGTQTAATLFKVTPAGVDAYGRKIPLATPPLETNEEFPVVRAKRRPVLVITPAAPQMPVKPLSGGSWLSWPIAVVVPCYGVADKTGRARLPSEFIERVRRLEFPEFFFLPGHGAAMERDSLVSVFRITHVFESHLEPTQWKLSDPVLRILQGQIRFYLTKQYEGDYANAREMLLNP